MMTQSAKGNEATGPANRARLAERLERLGVATLPAPLSFAQQRLWFLDQLEPDTSLYNVPAALRIFGPLRTAALEASLRKIVERHGVFRTRFSCKGADPVQVVADRANPSLEYRDLTDIPAERREAEAMRLTQEFIRIPFNLSSAGLLRVWVLKLGDAHHLLVFSMHHIVSD